MKNLKAEQNVFDVYGKLEPGFTLEYIHVSNANRKKLKKNENIFSWLKRNILKINQKIKSLASGS